VSRRRPYIDGLETWADLTRLALELVVFVLLLVSLIAAVVTADAVLNGRPS